MNLIGKLHPLIVHFPIALLVAALLFALWARVRGGHIKHAIRPLLIFGAGMAVFAVATGWMLAEHENFFGRAAQNLLLHRWLGVGGTAAAVILVFLIKERRPEGPLGFAGLAVVAAVVSVTGHFGGLLVFGADHWVIEDAGSNTRLVDPAGPKRVGQPESPDAPADLSKLPEKVTYAHVRPVFRKSCLRCHDARKRKGDLRLDQKKFAMEGGESGVVIKPGDSKGSRLFEMVSLPRDHEDYMPSKGDPLSQFDVALIGRWIDQGADWPD
jgi:uncharacterized membrane protein